MTDESSRNRYYFEKMFDKIKDFVFFNFNTDKIHQDGSTPLFKEEILINEVINKNALEMCLFTWGFYKTNTSVFVCLY